jgi:hypothetical protein
MPPLTALLDLLELVNIQNIIFQKKIAAWKEVTALTHRKITGILSPSHAKMP